MVGALYKPLPSKKLNQRGENGATDLHPMASDFFFEFKKIRISVRYVRELLACQHACMLVIACLSLLCYSVHTGKQSRYIFKSSLFQAVAQVNPTAQNTFLLSPLFSSFLVSRFICSDPLCIKPLVDCFEQLFLFSSCSY
jgi:hypothetical protein